MQKRKTNELERRARVSPTNVESFVVLMLRRLTIFRSLLHVVPWQQLEAARPDYNLFLRIAKEYFDRHDVLPSREILRSEILSAIEADRTIEAVISTESAERFISYAFLEKNFSSTKLANGEFDKWALQVGGSWFQELLGASASMMSTGVSVISDLRGYMEGMAEQMGRIQAAAIPEGDDLFSEGWDQSLGVDKFTTGVSFLDNAMRGGQANGEAYVVTGPYGSCKTLLALQMLTACATYFSFSEKQPEWDGVRRYPIYIGFEADENEVRIRVLLNHARIKRDTLENMFRIGGMSGLSTADNLQEYERKMYASQLAQGIKVPGERERCERTVKLMNSHLLVFDLTGRKQAYRGLGNTVDELASMIEGRLRQKSVNGIQAVAGPIVVDYVQYMAKRTFKVGQDSAVMRQFLASLPSQARERLGARFNCPVWLLAQLNAKGNKKAPGHKIDRTDFGECATLLENSDFGFAVGAGTLDGYARLQVIKHRRNAPVPDSVVKIDGQWGRVVQANHMAIDHGTSSIVSKSDLSVVGDILPSGSSTSDDSLESGAMQE